MYIYIGKEFYVVHFNISNYSNDHITYKSFKIYGNNLNDFEVLIFVLLARKRIMKLFLKNKNYFCTC